MINEKHDGILNGPRVLLLRDKFNKSLIIFKIDARIFIYTRKTSILTAMHSCKCFILRIFKGKKDFKFNCTCIINTNHYLQINQNKYIQFFILVSTLIFIFNNNI